MLEEMISRNLLKLQESIFSFNTEIPKPCDWVEDNLFLTSAESKFAGRFSYDRSPYTKEPLENMRPNSGVMVTAIMKCSQSGYTQGVIIPCLLYHISESPTNLLFLSGSDTLVRETIRGRFDPVVDNSGLRYLIKSNSNKKSNQKTGDTDTKKEFTGGSLLNKTYKASNFRQYSVEVVCADEYDDAFRSDKLEGSIRSLIFGRTKSYADTRRLAFVSSPTTEGISNIEEVWEMGDKRQWNWCCPHCKDYIPILWRIENEDGSFSGIKWELDVAGNLIDSSVHYECQSCKGKIEYKQKYNLNLTGQWIPTAKPKEPNYRSYSSNALCNPPGFESWADLVKQFLEACPPGKPVNTDLLKTFVNTQLGQLWKEQGKKIEITGLMKNIKEYKVGAIPDITCVDDGNGKIALISLACDLGGIMDIENRNEDVRLDWEILVHTSNGQTYSVNQGSIGTFKRNQDLTKKDVAENHTRTKWTYREGMPNNVWEVLDDIIRTPLQGESGMYYDIDITVIDTGGFEPDNYAMNFIRKIDRRVIGVKGLRSEQVRSDDKNNTFIQHSREDKGLLYVLDVNRIKDMLSGNISLKRGVDGYEPVGFMNFPMAENGKYSFRNYFEHYSAEHRVPDIKNGINVGYVWKKKRENNHFFDVAVYGLAAKYIYIATLKLEHPEYPRDLSWDDYCYSINHKNYKK